jgi:DNA-binding MarR family transcriptional regulator
MIHYMNHSWNDYTEDRRSMPEKKREELKSSERQQRPLGLLLSQIGTHAALTFGRKIKSFGISPPHVGILRWIRDNVGENQRQLASHLGVLPSRLVLLLDELETKGLVARQRSTQDRRNQQLQLTRKGTRLLERVEQVAAAHEADLGSALTESERETLIDLCAKLAAHRGLPTHGHPGYMRRLVTRGQILQAKVLNAPKA